MDLHPIEARIQELLKDGIKGEGLEIYAREFAERLESSLNERFKNKINDTREAFFLRMSNIGLPLRQLCLQRDYGRTIFNPAMSLNAYYGVMLESLALFLLKASGCKVEAQNQKVELKVGKYVLPGELDLIVEGAVWDVKSASPYSYANKFINYQTLEANDSFGYMGQLFGYAMAANKPVGGWIVINKAKGLIKTVTVPIEVQETYKRYYMDVFEDKFNHITGGKPAPACGGVVPELFYKKKTGNYILDRECEWCDYKSICHPNVQKLHSLCSEARDKPTKYYVKIDEKYK